MKGGRNLEKTQKYRADVAETLTRLLAKRKGVVPGKMFGFPAFYANGKLFACVYGGGVGLKLPEAMVRDLEGKPGFAPFRPYGMAKMREWVQITRGRAEDYAAEAKLFIASMAFVRRTAIQRKASGGTRGDNRRSRRSADVR